MLIYYVLSIFLGLIICFVLMVAPIRLLPQQYNQGMGGVMLLVGSLWFYLFFSVVINVFNVFFLLKNKFLVMPIVASVLFCLLYLFNKTDDTIIILLAPLLAFFLTNIILYSLMRIFNHTW